MPFLRQAKQKPRVSCANHPPETRDVDCQEVERAAYALYEERGRQDGQALEDWLKAEAIVQSRAHR